MKPRAYLLALLAFACLGGDGRTPAPVELLRVQTSADAMGSTYSIVMYGANRTAMEAAAEAAFVELRRIDALISNYRPESPWSELNRKAYRQAVRVNPELADLLARCLEYSRASDGAFDISVGPLIKLWGFYKDEGRLPKRRDVESALRVVGYGHLLFDFERRTLKFDRNGVELDPGGIGKGYAVDRMVAILRQRGVDAALVAGSNSSIYGMGTPPEETRGWRIEIQDPKNQRKTVGEVYLKDMSMSTSGSYEKYFRADGRRYSHIMDPRTGYPAQGTASVSVVAPRTIDSEAWTKPYFINGREWTHRHKRGDFRVFFCKERGPCEWLP